MPQSERPCDQSNPDSRLCEACTHKCPMGEAMANNKVPWWVWAMCVSGVIAVALLVKLIL